MISIIFLEVVRACFKSRVFDFWRGRKDFKTGVYTAVLEDFKIFSTKPGGKRPLLKQALRLWLGLFLSTQCQAANTSSGPVSLEEATLLWTQSRRLFEIGDHKRATPLLERFVNRYPGYLGYLEAHCLLGMSQLELGNTLNAIEPLKFCISRKKTLDSERAHWQLWLGKAYLELKKFDEAFLVAMEILEPHEKEIDSSDELRVESLLLKSLALVGLRQYLNAKNSVDAARKILGTQSESIQKKLLGQFSAADFYLKTQECLQYPTPGYFHESQLQDQINRRGHCLQESILLFRDTLKTNEKKSVAKVSKELSVAFESFSAVCRKPPLPSEVRSKKRTPQQLLKQRSELGYYLRQDCLKHFQFAQQILLRFENDTSKQWSQVIKKIRFELDQYLAQISFSSPSNSDKSEKPQ